MGRGRAPADECDAGMHATTRAYSKSSDAVFDIAPDRLTEPRVVETAGLRQYARDA